MKTSLCLVVSLAVFAGCGPDGLRRPTPGLRVDVVAGIAATAHDESGGGCGGLLGANESSCPATWADARALCSAGTPCAVLGKACHYPNAGDGLPDGTWATALLFCTDIHASELGLDAGTGVWTCAQ